MEIRLQEDGLVGTFRTPSSGRAGPFPGILALGGSDGGTPEYFLNLFCAERLRLSGSGVLGYQRHPDNDGRDPVRANRARPSMAPHSSGGHFLGRPRRHCRCLTGRRARAACGGDVSGSRGTRRRVCTGQCRVGWPRFHATSRGATIELDPSGATISISAVPDRRRASPLRARPVDAAPRGGGTR
jgi:hypothetical protein